jgi:hypothetical protein
MRSICVAVAILGFLAIASVQAEVSCVFNWCMISKRCCVLYCADAAAAAMNMLKVLNHHLCLVMIILSCLVALQPSAVLICILTQKLVNRPTC